MIYGRVPFLDENPPYQPHPILLKQAHDLVEIADGMGPLPAAGATNIFPQVRTLHFLTNPVHPSGIGRECSRVELLFEGEEFLRNPVYPALRDDKAADDESGLGLVILQSAGITRFVDVADVHG